MNLADKHPAEKAVSAIPLFKGEGLTTVIQILEQQELKEHISKVPALLICVIGEVIFENEKGIKETLKNGDYLEIEPFVKHRVVGIKDTQLLLLK